MLVGWRLEGENEAQTVNKQINHSLSVNRSIDQMGLHFEGNLFVQIREKTAFFYEYQVLKDVHSFEMMSGAIDVEIKIHGGLMKYFSVYFFFNLSLKALCLFYSEIYCEFCNKN